MSKLTEVLTDEQKKKYMLHYESSKDFGINTANLAVKRYFPFSTKKTRFELTSIYSKGMEKGEEIFKEAVKKEYDVTTTRSVAEKVIDTDVRQCLTKLPKLYRDKKKKALKDFYRESIRDGAISSFDTFKLLVSFEEQNEGIKRLLR